MNPMNSIASPAIGPISPSQLQVIQARPRGAAETQAFQQAMAGVLGNLLSGTSSAQLDPEEAPVVPTGSSLQPLQMSLILAQVNQKAGQV